MVMNLPANKTKIVCTLGPSSSTSGVIEQMILAGMDVARLNFSHGDFATHAKVIETLRSAALTTGSAVTIMADLPGPKMRVGQIADEPLDLKAGDLLTLTTEEIVGDRNRISVTFNRLPHVVKPADTLFLNDGIIQLEVISVRENDVACRVIAGGELRSRKGLNLPGINLGISAFTERDHECLKFAMEMGIDAVSQSFVESGADIDSVRNAANALGYSPFIIAKIERSRALDNIDEILEAADGIMIARGDLGVEIPIEQIALVQKRIMQKACQIGKPVITATQMLESMTTNRRPTRAEATDVANAVLDGTDCVMLSGESATGMYPVEAVAMLGKIAATIEPYRPGYYARETLKTLDHDKKMSFTDLIALSVETTVERISPAAVFVPTRGGGTARSIARFRLPVWLIAISSQESTCRQLQFSYGVFPQREPDHPDDWKVYIKHWMRTHEMEGNVVVLTEGPSSKHPEANNRMEIVDLR
jgi:pyruvate kinase